MNTLEQLKEKFTSDKNKEYILTSVISHFYKSSNQKIKLKYDELLYDIFNKVATQVFLYETKSGNIYLEKINDIIIHELKQFIHKNLNNFNYEEPPVRDYHERDPI